MAKDDVLEHRLGHAKQMGNLGVHLGALGRNDTPLNDLGSARGYHHVRLID